MTRYQSHAASHSRNHSRFLPLCLSALLLVWIGVPWNVANGQPPNRPNIVVVLVDDMGLMDTSVPFLTDGQGAPERHPLNDFYRTPNMERLARQGMRFSNFYSMSVCSPTRTSLITGQTSARHHTTNWVDPDKNNRGKFGPPEWRWEGLTGEETNLVRLLRDAGYRTIHCGKGHFGPFGSRGSDSTQLGFDLNIGGSAMGQPGSYYGSDNYGNEKGKHSLRGVPGLEAYHGSEVFLTESLTLEMNKALATAVSDNKPFFAYMSHYAVHAPFHSDPRFIDHYPDQPKNLAAFGSLIEGMDKSLGDMLDQLERLGVAENTLVFFLGDNGTDSPRGDQYAISCAAPLRGKKGTHYEGGMRAPFMVAWAKPSPGNPLQARLPIEKGAIVDQLAAVYDLFPTILSVVEIQSDQTIDGMDLSKFLGGQPAPAVEREFLMHYPHEHRSNYFTAYRRGDWKLVYHYRKPVEERFELFDLGEDRSESHNLATTNPEKLREILLAMQQALEKCDAQYPLADDGQTPLKPSL